MTVLFAFMIVGIEVIFVSAAISGSAPWWLPFAPIALTAAFILSLWLIWKTIQTIVWVVTSIWEGFVYVAELVCNSLGVKE